MNFLKKFFIKDVENAIPLAFDAEILRREGRYEEALVNINSAIDIDKKNPDYYMQRALIYRALKMYDKALSDINKSIKMNSHFNRYYMYRHIIHKEMNNIGAANNDLKLMDKNKYNNNLDTLYEYLGKEFRDRGLPKDAVFYFKKALEYNPNNGRIKNELEDLERDF